VPAGSTISSNGTVLGPNGNPVLGSDGKPLTVPPGSSVVPGTGSSSANPLLSALPSNSPFQVPAGSSIGPNGTVLGPNGNPVLGANGPVTLPAGSSISPSGAVIGPNGQPLPSSFLVSPGGAPPMPALPQPSVPTVSSGPLAPSLGALTTGTGALNPGVSTTGPVGLNPVNGVTGGVLSTSSGVTGTAVGSGSQLPPSPVVPGGTTGISPGAVAASSPVAGPASTATPGGPGMPFMPPMGGMGGMGGGAQPEGQGQRNTWLVEDDEVWGTDSEALPGVIGRRRRTPSRKAVSGVAFPNSSAESPYGAEPLYDTEPHKEGTDEFTIPGTA
jgi:hypothetical protein